ncbi:hypothetical protein XFF6992_450049 [Xanthomonas citri pv. fuscans]|nr:hypothetical protein XFF6992_450049 [Xanthomonas citri pv. fuscans]
MPIDAILQAGVAGRIGERHRAASNNQKRIITGCYVDISRCRIKHDMLDFLYV